MDNEKGSVSMQKYCIIPRQGNDFWQLVRGLPLSEQDKKILQECKIKHVEISLKQNSWEILLQTRSRLAHSLLETAGEYIAAKCKIRQVVFYQDVIDLEAEIEKNWNKIREISADGNPTVTHLLLKAKRHFDGNRLTIEVLGELAEEIMQAHAVVRMMQKAIKDLLGFACEIDCQTAETAETLPSDDFMTAEYLEALQHEQRQDVPAAGNDRSTPKASSSPLIFGKNVQGEPIPISDLDGEMKSIVLAGIIGTFDVREFKTGTKLLTFSLADKTDGISCKTFFKDKDEFERVQNSMANGMAVKIKDRFVLIPFKTISSCLSTAFIKPN